MYLSWSKKRVKNIIYDDDKEEGAAVVGLRILTKNNNISSSSSSVVLPPFGGGVNYYYNSNQVVVIKPISFATTTTTTDCCYLKCCHLCHKPLTLDKEVYMYRGDLGFCSVECRDRQIYLDEINEMERILLICRRRRSCRPNSDSSSKINVFSYYFN